MALRSLLAIAAWVQLHLHANLEPPGLTRTARHNCASEPSPHTAEPTWHRRLRRAAPVPGDSSLCEPQSASSPRTTAAAACHPKAPFAMAVASSHAPTPKHVTPGSAPAAPVPKALAGATLPHLCSASHEKLAFEAAEIPDFSALPSTLHRHIRGGRSTRAAKRFHLGAYA